MRAERARPWGLVGPQRSSVCVGVPPPPPLGDASEGEGPQRRPQGRLGMRLEEVAKAVGGGYCRLQMPLRLALGVRGTVAGHRLGPLEKGGGGTPPPFQCIPGPHLLFCRIGAAPPSRLPLCKTAPGACGSA